ncbi:hypothetical protein GAY29_19435 [Azospirillum brasilense]|uniref:MobA/MobL family protein n=1 Tax=Azospirillum brasilense TaxID=192 RepID=UPI00190C01AA|nr:MobA/MobL family protein [Azospirillum brasilense]MBK3735241.1 hypothetical protein [Azospirillum brasilense]
MAALSRQYHCQVKPVSRSTGRSVVAAAAYRAGVCLTDRLTGIVHDYRLKAGIVLAEVIVPPGCAWANRAALWDAVEAKARANGRLATECELAIPHELTPEQAAALVRGFAAEVVAEHRVAADVAIHRPHRRQGGGDPRNAHAHVLFSHLPVTPEGLGKPASKVFAGAAAVEAIRSRWCEHVNRAYAAAGLDKRQDHRSYRSQGLDLAPGQHLGPQATALERAGVPTAPGDHNRAAREVNSARHRAHRLEAHSQAVERLPSLRLPEWAPGDPRPPRHVERPPRERSGAQSRETRDYVARLAYGQPLPPGVADRFDRLWTYKEPTDAIKLRLADGAGRLLDRGDQIAYQPARGHRADTASAVAAALGLAEAKGWRSVVLSGPVSFQRAAALEAVRRGLEVEDPAPEIAALVAAERARLSAAQEPHRALIDRINARAETSTPAVLRNDLMAAVLPVPAQTVAAIGAEIERRGTPPTRSAWTDATHRRAVAHAYAGHRAADTLIEAVDARRLIGALCAATPADERQPIAALLAAARAVVGEDAAEDWRSLCALIPPPEGRAEHARRLAEAVAYFDPPAEPQPEPVIFLDGDADDEAPDVDQPEQDPETAPGHGETAPAPR